MKHIPIYLKATDKQHLHQFLLSKGWKSDEESGELFHDNITKNEIGVMSYIPQDQIDLENPTLILVEGWHCNLLVPEDLVNAYTELSVIPKSPSYTFAGY